MVSLKDVQSSNSRMSATLPPGLVAVFAGATAGIGESSMREFARHAPQPRIYFVGRSQESGDRLTAELKTLNPGGQYIFVKSDTSLLRNVDAICKDVQSKEKAINVLFISQGTLKFSAETDEGLNYLISLSYYSRLRFIANLLPLLSQATGLRRVVAVMAAGHEGKLYADDFASRNIPMSAARGHLCSMLTLALEALAKNAPTVSFIHNFPGSVDTGLIRGDEGMMVQVMKYTFKVILLFKGLPIKECGERHAFLCASARYPPGKKDGTADSGAGVPLSKALCAARGTDGVPGSGVYSVNWDGEVSKLKVDKLLAKYRREGMVERLWKHTEGEFRRITGFDSV